MRCSAKAQQICHVLQQASAHVSDVVDQHPNHSTDFALESSGQQNSLRSSAESCTAKQPSDTHLKLLAVADEQACAAEAPGGGVAARAVRLADALCGGAAPAAARAALLTTQLLLAAEVAGDACSSSGRTKR
jgi:hypothetical protein